MLLTKLANYVFTEVGLDSFDLQVKTNTIKKLFLNLQIITLGF